MGVAFLLDVDNTLLDNDAAKAAIAAGVAACVSPADAARFWKGYERVRWMTVRRYWAASRSVLARRR